MVPFLDLSGLGLPKPTLAMRLSIWWRMTREILFDAPPPTSLIKIGDSEIRFGATEVPPNGVVEFEHQLERATKVKRFVLESPDLDVLFVEQIFAGRQAQIVHGAPVPAKLFGANSSLGQVIGAETAHEGSMIRIVIQNSSKKPVWVSARAITKVIL